MEILDYVYTTNVVSKQICKDILSVIKNQEWEKHKWHSNITNTSTSEETKELDVQPTSQSLQNILTPFSRIKSAVSCGFVSHRSHQNSSSSSSVQSIA